jgi:large subunit ribosomal protein L21
MWAVVEISKKQFIVKKGDKVYAPRQEQKEGELTFDNVLLLANDADIKVGAPYVAGAKVTAKIEGEEKGDKVRIYKYKRRKKYRKTQGHRQKYTLLTIGDIQP